ncbi:hypothetical protein DL767_004644 [Monosporascus sp. MG133]|nr:hypothetical protein DL767_004644 [Monosporascus sp. MG133]
MSKKDMNLFASDMDEEIDLAFREVWGTSKDWTVINGWDGCGRIIARAAERMMIGLPMGRNEELLDASRLYANSVLLGGAVMNCFPPLLRKLIGPVIALRAKFYQRRCVNLLVPIIDGRLRIWNEDGDADGAPDDFLQWLIATCDKDGPHQLDATRIANRLIALMTPLIFAVCYVFAHSVLDLYGAKDRNDFISGLEAECKRVSTLHNGLSTAEAVDELYRVDSTIRESMRTSDVTVVNLYRDVISGHLDIGNGLSVPRGVRMAFPTQNIHLDPDNYENPRQFDAFRFSRKFEGLNDNDRRRMSSERELITTPTLSFLPLGYGRHACPGRWFAAQTMKQALAYIIMNYDIELIGRSIQRQALLNTMVPPVGVKMRIRRRA